MANPIKPTGPGPVAPPLPDAQPGDRGAATGNVRTGTGDFRRELTQAAQAASSPPTEATAAAAGPRGSAAVFADLRAGHIDRGQAVDRLVAHQLERVAPAGLTPAARAELESLLRNALENDPNLARLVEDASREG